jgi:hypothetical protein
MAMQARCPQWWSVFSVRGKTGIYEVCCDHVLRGTWRCCCPAHRRWPDTTCKHIQRVLNYGCLAGPGRSAGRNDLGAGRVSITGSVPRLYNRTRLRCACGEMMRAPLLRMDDGAGHQIVQVQFGDGGSAVYAYAWGGKRALAVGDEVFIAPPSGQRQWSPARQVTVVALGSDWADVLTVIGD